MTSAALSRLRDLFVAAPADAPVTQVATRAIPSTLAVLTTTEDGPVAGAALGLAAAAALRSRCAVVCLWSGGDDPQRDAAASRRAGDPASVALDPTAPPPRPGVASGVARRLADRLVARGLSAAARGRLVTVSLPAGDVEARAAAERTMAAGGDAPVVLVIAGPRSPALDPLLAAADRIVIVPPPDAPVGLESFAVDDAARLGRSTSILRLPRAGTAANHLLTSTGLVLSPSLRAAATTALEGGHA